MPGGWSAGAVLVSLSICAAGDAFAQASAECATADCARDQAAQRANPEIPAALVQDLASVDRLRLEFVEALRGFTAMQAVTIGDAAVHVAAAAAGLDRAQREWDTALATMRARAAQAVPSADLEMAQASRYLGRLAIAEALVHLDSAARDGPRRSEVQVARALALARTNRSAQAVNALRTAQTIAPDDPAIHYLLAQHWSGQNRAADAADALRAFARAVSRDIRAHPARFERLEFLRETAGVAPIFPMARYATGYALLSGGRLSEAVAELHRAAVHEQIADGTLATAIRGAGVTLRAAHVTVAIERLREDIARWPDSGALNRLLGVAYWIVGEQSEAVTYLRRSRDLEPADERARLALADLFIEAGRVAEAERELTAALAAAPASGRARYRLAQLRLDAGNLSAAVSLLRDTMQLSPPIVGRDHVLHLLGSTLVKVADFDGAAAAYTQRVAVNPNSATAHRQLAEVYFLQGRHDEAIGEFTAASWLDANDARAQAGLAQVLLRLGRYADAARAAKSALAIDAGLAEARFALGTALLRLGRQDEGRAHLVSFQAQQAAAQLQGRIEFELDAVRRAAARHVNTPAEAVPLLERARDAAPEQPQSHRDLGLALLRAGDADRGRDHLERAQQIEPTADIARRLADLYRRSNIPEASARHQAEYDRLRQAEMVRRLKMIVLSGTLSDR